MHKLAVASEPLIVLLSFYGVAANVWNQHFGYTVVPVNKPFGIFMYILHIVPPYSL